MFEPTSWTRYLAGGLCAFLVLMVLLKLIGRVPLSYNLRNLTVRWLTTLMTAGAFTLVIFLMVAMLGFVNGMYTLTIKSGQEGNVIVLADGSTDETFSSLDPTDVDNVDKHPEVRTVQIGDAPVPLCSREVYVVMNQPLDGPKGPGTRRMFVQLRGIENPIVSGLVHGLKLQGQGVWFNPVAGVEPAPNPNDLPLVQAVMGAGLASELGTGRPGGKPLVAGDTISLGGRTWIVKGVFEPSGTSFDSEVWAKRTLIGPIFGKERLSSVVISTLNLATATKLSNDLKESKRAPLNAQPEVEYFSKMAETSKQFLYGIIVVAAVMAVGGLFGIMNTMFAAISQRSKDIALLRIIGYGRRSILVSFLFEALIIALIGGLLGCALGALTHGAQAKSIVSSGQGGGKFVVLETLVSLDILALGMLLSLFMGLLGGLLPSLSAMRYRALDSLR